MALHPNFPESPYAILDPAFAGSRRMKRCGNPARTS